MMTAILAALVLVAGSVVAYLLARKQRKSKAPDATGWIGPVGLVVPTLPLSARFRLVPAEVVEIVAAMESFLAVQITPVVVVFVEGLIPIEGGRMAAGIHHPAKLWTHSWIELSVGGGDWWPKTLSETAFEHELLHHASGMPDSVEFRVLFDLYQKRAVG